MADPAVPDAAQPAPAAATPAPQASAEIAAAVPTPAPAPAEPVAPAAPVEASVAEPAAETEAKPHTDEPTLLEGGEEKKPEPGAPKPEGDTPKPPEPAAFAFKPYTLPEGMVEEPKRIEALNSVLTNDKLSPQERGQELVNMASTMMADYDKSLRQQQHETFAKTRQEWRKQAMGDEEMGGAGWDTSHVLIAKARDQFVDQKHREAFNTFLRVTGAGDHPEFLRVMRAVGDFVSESPVPRNPHNPPPDLGRKPTGGRRSAMYDHPSSPNNKG